MNRRRHPGKSNQTVAGHAEPEWKLEVLNHTVSLIRRRNEQNETGCPLSEGLQPYLRAVCAIKVK